MQRTILLVWGIFLTALVCLGLIDQRHSMVTPEVPIASPIDSLSTAASPESTIRLTFVGDLMCHQEQLLRARTEDGYNFWPSFQWISPYIDQADFAFANLETTFSGTEKWRRFNGYPSFNTPDDFATAIKQAGFDMVSLANNHAMDYGEYGLTRTIEVLGQQGLKQAGVRRVDEVRSPCSFMEVKGVRLAVLAYTAQSNGSLEKSDSLSLFRLDPTKILKHITYARTLGADLVIVHFHYGKEYLQRPTALQLEAVKAAVRAGADIVLGDHPHVLQPLNTFSNHFSHVDHTLVAYSLGNFLSDQQGIHTRAGLMLTVELQKTAEGSKKPFELKKVEVVPTATVVPLNDNSLHAIVPTHVAAELKPVPKIAHQVRNALELSDYQLKILRQTERNTRELIKLRDFDVVWDRGY